MYLLLLQIKKYVLQFDEIFLTNGIFFNGLKKICHLTKFFQIPVSNQIKKKVFYITGTGGQKISRNYLEYFP